MENIDATWILMCLIILLPVFFVLGWASARIDMKTVLQQAKQIPSGFYTILGALVDKNTARAAQDLSELLEQQPELQAQNIFDLNLTLGKLYRQRGENDKAIILHKNLLDNPDIVKEKYERVSYELGLDYKSAGLVDRAEQMFLALQNGNMSQQANELLLNIYQQDRDWEKAIQTAQLLAHDAQTYQFEIAQFYCEMAQEKLFQSQFDLARDYVQHALNADKKCTRANMILGDIEQKQGNYAAAIAAYSAIEKQNYAYLSMIAERLYDAYEAQDKAHEGLEVLIGYAKTFIQLDLIDTIYDKALLIYGESKANQLAIELIRIKPNLTSVYRLLSLQMSDLNPMWKADADMMRNVIGQKLQKSMMYRCHHCHFKSQIYFWHCPACNKWATFTPNKIEV